MKYLFAIILILFKLGTAFAQVDFENGAGKASMTLSEIRHFLVELKKNRETQVLRKEFAQDDIFQKSIVAIQQLQFYQGQESIELILMALSSTSSVHRNEAMTALARQTNDDVLPVLRFLVSKKSMPSPFDIFNAQIQFDFTIAEQAADILGSYINRPDVLEVVQEALELTPTKLFSVRRKLSGALRQCHALDCFKLAQKLNKAKDPFEKANYIRIYKNFQNNPVTQSLILKALNSSDHPVKAAAADALVGVQDNSYIPLIEIASRAMYSGTRLKAIAALRNLNHSDIFEIYKEGLLDSSLEVRILTMNELGLRKDLKASELLRSFFNFKNSGEIRSESQQMKRAPRLERLTEEVRGFSKGLDPMNPSLAYMETFNSELKSIKYKIGLGFEKGWTEERIAEAMLKKQRSDQVPIFEISHDTALKAATDSMPQLLPRPHLSCKTLIQ